MELVEVGIIAEDDIQQVTSLAFNPVSFLFPWAPAAKLFKG